MSRKTERFIAVFFIGLFASCILAVAIGIGSAIKDDNDRKKWAADCHASGRVVVPIGNWNHCMTWEEIKEEGIELEN